MIVKQINNIFKGLICDYQLFSLFVVLDASYCLQTDLLIHLCFRFTIGISFCLSV